ncbi:hypothetical protein [Tenacibaculum sp. MAR_2009_124]|uniref:hypothetical protein n=1 Tax=Tenacibaculum sp. MAR_2009_124 TaxID=1250059 RepID=UPI000B879ACF|nr:hypothetical protein [Tenacibaculum sp. MAR_2009_124]
MPKKSSSRIPLGIKKVPENIVNKTLSDLKGNDETTKVDREIEEGDALKKQGVKKRTIEKEAKEETNDSKKLKSFKKMIGSEFYNDKKVVFNFSLSGDCSDKVEELVFIYNYKNKAKLNRNDVIRKLVEKFALEDAQNLIDELE